tara:strand:- start:145 stop:357 length:213 start_codon:yes stop_codon:yes gene_type:complete
VHLKKFVQLIAKETKKKFLIKNLNMQKGDVKTTNCNNKITIRDLKYKPKITIEIGIKRFVKWYLDYNDKK